MFRPRWIEEWAGLTCFMVSLTAGNGKEVGLLTDCLKGNHFRGKLKVLSGFFGNTDFAVLKRAKFWEQRCVKLELLTGLLYLLSSKL